MVVAARAGDGQAVERLRHHVNAVVDNVVAVAIEVVAHRDETQRGQRGAVLVVRQAVGGELFADELVVRLVVVERLHHVVTVSPREGIGRRLLFLRRVADGVRVTRDIQPVPAPTLAVVRRGEEFVHELRVGGGGFVSDERFDFCGRGRQADEVEVEAADEHLFVGGTAGLEVFLLQLREDVVVHRVRGPSLVLHGGRRRELHGLEGPPYFALAGVGVFALGRAGAWVGRAHLDPRDEVGDLRVGELLALGRHLEVRVRVADGADERGLVRVAGDDSGAGIAALEHALAGVEREAALDFALGGAVALEALAGEDGANLVLEERGLVGGERGRGGDGGRGFGCGSGGLGCRGRGGDRRFLFLRVSGKRPGEHHRHHEKRNV